jgi:hypothetical protein
VLGSSAFANIKRTLGKIQIGTSTMPSRLNIDYIYSNVFWSNVNGA